MNVQRERPSGAEVIGMCGKDAGAAAAVAGQCAPRLQSTPGRGWNILGGAVLLSARLGGRSKTDRVYDSAFVSVPGVIIQDSDLPNCVRKSNSALYRQFVTS